MTAAAEDSHYQAGPPSQRLARIGEIVAARLAATHGVQTIPVDGIAMFVYPDFLPAGECARLIAMIDAGSQPSALFSEGADNSYRTSHSCNLDRWDDEVEAIDNKVCLLLGIDPRHGETLQGQRYRVGQEFKPHHDFFHVDQPYWAEMEASGGQRSWTAMIYLNMPEAGGATDFPMAGISVNPRPGLLLAWNNMGPDGAPNLRTLHAGSPVAAGTKYIVTKWFRERPWI
ncbi:2OG-Fe(II) oxygenase [Sphingomonas sp. LaA6.9]|uniref:prolyl hydroxylase family protein n=1 Tax=Sphingomonas sp. LaA6.9 TaxID=2919914 RepID=UPI001F4F6182|nr:2OG-Fe(II) oxygenase [Sphingomonas sp. LaA6.9]MCJ8158635.1 2OG-Fe(II) oxygenase [Sphingomonas sp. LaA6.9]